MPRELPVTGEYNMGGGWVQCIVFDGPLFISWDPLSLRLAHLIVKVLSAALMVYSLMDSQN
jgi:hypothetical protein